MRPVELLYYEEKSSEENYGTAAPGELSIPRLIDGKPCWRKPTTKSALKKKTLVLHSSSSSQLSHQTTHQLINEVNALIKEGFVIYQFHHNKLIKLNESNLHLLRELKNNRSTATYSPAEVKQLACKKLKLSREKLQLIDDHEIRLLTTTASKDEKYERSIDLDTLYNETEKMDGDRTKEWLANFTLDGVPIKSVIQHTLRTYPNERSVSIKNKLPDSMQSCNFQSIVILTRHTENSIDSLEDYQITPVKKITLSTTKMNPDQIPDWHHVRDIFQRCENIEELTITNSPLSDIKDWDFSNLEKIRFLEMKNSTISPDILSRYLEKMSELQELRLSQIDINLESPVRFKLENLERLELTSCENTIDILEPILKESKKLKSLKLNEISLFNEIDWSSIDLSSLEEIEIINCDISDEFITNLISKAPNIKSIKIMGDIPLTNNLFNAPTPNLEKLTLKYMPVDPLGLHTLLQNSPRLKQLNLTNITAEGMIPLPKIQALEQLCISISNSDLIHPSNIAQTISSSKYLTELHLNITTIATQLQSFQTIDQYNLSNVEALTLTIDEETDHKKESYQLVLMMLFEHADKLTNLTLDIKRFDFSLDNLMLDENTLPNLTYCNLGKASIDDAALITMLRSAPNLQYLDLVETSALEKCPHSLNLIKSRGIRVMNSGLRINLDKLNVVAAPQPTSAITSPSSQIAPNATKTLDANTVFNPNATFNTNRIFFALDKNKENPPVNNYRLQIFNTATINPNPCQLKEAFTLHREGDLDLSYRQILKYSVDTFEAINFYKDDSETTHYYGKQTLHVSHEWQPLASLSPNEEMKLYHVPPKSGIKIRYSERDNQYYIRMKKDKPAKTITIDYILAVPTPSQVETLPSEVQSLVDYYRSFGAGSIETGKPDPTGEDYFQSIFQQRVGACRHRSLILKEHLHRIYPDYPTRIIDNDCHSYIEIKVNDTWVQCDLGGHRATLNIDDRNDPRNPSAQPHISRVAFEEESASVKHFKSRLTTWESHADKSESLSHYCQRQIDWSANIKNRLIKVSNDDDVLSLHLSLLTHCQSIHRPVIYIDSPDDLACPSTHIAREGNEGKIVKGRGGRLHDFLTATYDDANPPIIIVNYNNFAADDIVRLNSVIDKDRRVDETPIPKSALLIGIMNTSKPGCYQGEDFYSRFDHVETCSLTLPSLTLPLISPSEEIDRYAINLKHAHDWKEQLLGHWQIQGDRLIFIEGELSKAIASGKPIEIQNGLWEDPKFVQFWHETNAEHRYAQKQNGITSPVDLTLIRTDGYDWQHLLKRLTLSPAHLPTAACVNPSLFNAALTQYRLVGDKLFSEPGLIEQFTGKTLDITLTKSISTDQWASLLLLCDKFDVKLNCHCASGIELPNELSMLLNTATPNPIPTPAHTEVIISNDCDAAIAADGLSDDKSWIIINVSECESSDLLLKLTTTFEEETAKYSFSETDGALITALKQGKNIALTGQFSPELEDMLTAFMLTRMQDDSVNGNLRVYHDNPQQFQSIHTRDHVIDSEFKRSLLLQQFTDYTSTQLIKSLSDETLNNTYTHLSTLVQTTTALSSTISTIDPWQGMYQLPSKITLEQFDAQHPENAEQLVAEFNQKRLNAVNSVLSHSPFVYLAGLTAVGKTTFVEKVLSLQESTVIYKGENKLLNWATDHSDNQSKILFIDEANISTREWSEFEGLFLQPPGILINGEYYELTPQHKVVFAGNPLSYGGERKLAPLFARHGGSVVFDPLPEVFIYQEIIKPVFKDSSFDSLSIAAMTEQFLEVYRYLCECSTEEVLISPREIQMMALLVESFHEARPTEPLDLAISHYTYLIANQLVPQHYRRDFDARFKPTAALSTHTVPNDQQDYLVTPSRVAINQHLNDLLALRDHRRCNPASTDAIKYGGLGGIIIEGEPGIGKSELAIHALVNNGYHEIHSNLETLPNKAFFRLPINMPQSEKEQLLLKAFDQGAVVIIDEINSAPMMERLLNDLLMGRDPNGKPPSQPGFMVIGTQNPATMSGRREATTALARRLTITTLPPYSKEEMIEILTQKGIDSSTATAMVIAYTSNVEYAQRNHLTPVPTFRNLIKEAEYLVEPINRNVSEIPRQDISESISELEEELTDSLTAQVADDPQTTRLSQSRHSIFSHEPEPSPPAAEQITPRNKSLEQ